MGAVQLSAALCGHLYPGVPIPQSAGMTGGYRQCWEVPELLFALQNALWQKCFRNDLLMHKRDVSCFFFGYKLFAKDKAKNVTICYLY